MTLSGRFTGHYQTRSISHRFYDETSKNISLFDLVKEQILVAQGAKLSVKQKDIKQLEIGFRLF